MASLVLQQARSYVKRGWSVIPIQPKSKTPALPSWKEFQDRLPTDAELVQWFEGPNANRNIAVVTGKVSSIVVLDFDGPEGMKTLQDLKVRSTVMSSTGKGKHLVFQRPEEGRGNSVRTLPGMDIRGDGGYVLVAPSIHPSGRRYAWVLDSTVLPKLPEALLGAPAAQGERVNPTGWVGAALADMQVGNIDNTLFKICARLRRDGYTKEEALVLLMPHASGAGATPDHLPAKIDHVWASYDSKHKEPELTSLSTFMDVDENVTWLVPGMVARSSIGFVAGLPETCKTWMTMDLAIETARGGKWLGLFQTEKAKVLFIDQERFAGETRRRFRAMFKAKCIDYRKMDGNLSILCGSTTRLDMDNSYEAFRRTLQDVQPDLVIVDSFATFHNKEENNRSDIQMVLERIKAIRNEFGCTICFIDHENKGAFQASQEGEEPSALRMAGSVAKPAAAEFIFTVRAKGKGMSGVYMTKATQGPTAPPFFVTVQDLDESRSAILVQGKSLA